jgi:hypothetical protein
VAAHRAGALLHGFEQRALRLGRRAVDFVGQQHVAEDRTGHEGPGAAAGAGSSSMMSVPVMSLGIRSGVNWMRLNSRPSTWAMVRTSSVLAVPGRPVIRQWPPTNRAIITCSSTSSWPTMTRRTCVTISACTWRKR